jgi:hypothetical protein
MPRLFAATDAEFELATTLSELTRIRDHYVTMLEYINGHNVPLMALRVDGTQCAVEMCTEAIAHFRTNGKGQNRDTNRLETGADAVDALQLFLDKTVHFRTLTASLVPLNISGSLGRVGSRVPDLHINRQVQEDLIDLVNRWSVWD